MAWSKYNETTAYNTSRPYNGWEMDDGKPHSGGTLANVVGNAKKRRDTDAPTQSPWEARTQYEREEAERIAKQKFVELELAKADAITTAPPAADTVVETVAKIFAYDDVAIDRVADVGTPLPTAQEIEAIALARRTEELQQQRVYEQQQLEARITKDAIRREEQRNAQVDASLSLLQRKLELDLQHQLLLESDDEAILRFIQEMETSEA